MRAKNGGACMELNVGRATLSGPILIPSISNFETQGNSAEALLLQDALGEPITLVSAHDTDKSPQLVAGVTRFRERGGAVFMDSGGYEASRIGRYVNGYRESWSIRHFEAASKQCEYDLAASFDMFIERSESISEFQYRFHDFLKHDNSFIPIEKLVPVLHLQDFDGTRFLEERDILSIVDFVAAEFEPVLIAIPERELGNGLRNKCSLVKKIKARLSEKGRKSGLHILGCGNPLSFAVLSDAGISMADGLEWCRTLVGPNFHLHHFQHGELFAEPSIDVYNATADVIRSTSQHYLTLTLSRNLHALQGFARQVSDAMASGKLKGFIEQNYGPSAASILA